MELIWAKCIKYMERNPTGLFWRTHRTQLHLFIDPLYFGILFYKCNQFIVKRSVQLWKQYKQRLHILLVPFILSHFFNPTPNSSLEHTNYKYNNINPGFAEVHYHCKT